MKLDKNLLKKLGIFIGIVIFIFIIIFIFKLISGGRMDYANIEKRLINAAKSYYKDNPDELPKNSNESVKITAEKLTENNKIKSLSELAKDNNAVCNGEVTVTNNNDLLLYSVSLNCGEYYESKKLNNVIVEKTVTSGEGLYNINGTYIFRGEKLNNYISFAGLTWRILRINNDGTIRIIETTDRAPVVWDDRYNSEKQSDTGINDYRLSRIKESIDELYKSEEFSKNDKAYIVNQNLCVGRRNEESQINDGSIECSDIIENQPFGLLQPNEFVLASMDSSCKAPSNPECKNYNYLTYFNRSFWTLTGDSSSTHRVFKASDTVYTTNANGNAQIRLVVNINSNVNYISGDGTKEKPYTFN